MPRLNRLARMAFVASVIATGMMVPLAASQQVTANTPRRRRPERTTKPASTPS